MNLLFLKWYNRNGKLGADQFAQATIKAIVILIGASRIIPFTIELFGFVEHLSRAEFNTQPAPLTPLL